MKFNITKLQKGKIITRKGDPYEYNNSNGLILYRKVGDTKWNTSSGKAKDAIIKDVFKQSPSTFKPEKLEHKVPVEKSDATNLIAPRSIQRDIALPKRNFFTENSEAIANQRTQSIGQGVEQKSKPKLITKNKPKPSNTIAKINNTLADVLPILAPMSIPLNIAKNIVSAQYSRINRKGKSTDNPNTVKFRDSEVYDNPEQAEQRSGHTSLISRATNLLPQNIAWPLRGVLGESTTQENLSDDELKELGHQLYESQQGGKQSGREGYEIGVDYSDKTGKRTGINSLKDMSAYQQAISTDPRQTTLNLGRYGAHKNKDGDYIVADNYNFDEHTKSDWKKSSTIQNMEKIFSNMGVNSKVGIKVPANYVLPRTKK